MSYHYIFLLFSEISDYIAGQLQHAFSLINIGMLAMLNLNITTVCNQLSTTSDPYEREILSTARNYYEMKLKELSKPTPNEVHEVVKSLHLLPLNTDTGELKD